MNTSDNDQNKAFNSINYASNNFLDQIISLREAMSKVLNTLIRTDQDSVVDQALLQILAYFDVDRVYIGIFNEQESIVDFTNEVTCDGIVSMREDLLRQLSKEDVPWWINYD